MNLFFRSMVPVEDNGDGDDDNGGDNYDNGRGYNDDFISISISR